MNIVMRIKIWIIADIWWFLPKSIFGKYEQESSSRKLKIHKGKIEVPHQDISQFREL